MNVLHMATVAFFTVVLTLAEVAPADAASAQVTGTVQVRSGPGTSFRVVGQLRRGDRVTIDRCSSSRRWCNVRSRYSRSGWVASRFLDRVSSGGGSRGGICFYGARGYICVGR